MLFKMKLTMEKAKLVEIEQAINLVGRPNKKQLDIAVVQIFLWKGDDVWKNWKRGRWELLAWCEYVFIWSLKWVRKFSCTRICSAFYLAKCLVNSAYLVEKGAKGLAFKASDRCPFWICPPPKCLSRFVSKEAALKALPHLWLAKSETMVGEPFLYIAFTKDGFCS